MDDVASPVEALVHEAIVRDGTSTPTPAHASDNCPAVNPNACRRRRT
ncbi:hypothetical protein ACPA54_38155 [Uniformispora flossi]